MIVYVITNLITGKQYVGQTIQTLSKRWARHGWHCTTSARRMPISDAIGKYGKENFTIKELKVCDSIEELNHWEMYYANTLNTWVPNGYNLKAGDGKGSMSEATRQKISQSNKGRYVSQETRKRLSESHKGIKMKDSTKKILSNLHKGKPLPELARRNSLEAITKTYHLVLADGTKEVVTNMAAYARMHGHSVSKLSELVTGKRKQYKGITLE